MRRPTSSLSELAALQDQVPSRVQLREVGYGARSVARREEAGTWRALGPRVVVLHRGPLSAAARRWVGVLHGGPASALATWSAAEAEGLRGFEEDVVTVAVPHGSELGHLEHDLLTVRVRQARRLDASVHPARLPRRVRLAVALVEAAADSESTDHTRAALAAAVQQRLVPPAALRSAAVDLPTLPQRRLILSTIGDIAGGAHSLPELDYARCLRLAGLPAPTRQRKVERPGGTWYLDNDFEPWLVTVEINGTQHLDMRAREYDDARRQALQLSGRIVVDLSSHLVRERSDEAALRTAAALAARGWLPSPVARQALDQAALRSKWTVWTAA